MKLLFREHHILPSGSVETHFARLSVYDGGNFRLSVKVTLSQGARRVHVTVYWMGENEPTWGEIYRGDFWDSIRTPLGTTNYQFPDEAYDPIEQRALERATMILDGE